MFRGSVIANAAFGEMARGARRESAESRARAALEQVGCAHLAGRSARELSGGERKRVAMARALAAEAETLLLDEPAAGVDAENTERLREVIAALAEQEKTILLSTHQPEWVADIADRQISIAYGRLDSSG
jgi:energy-coupling factor transporter ATP-binding protein EcfA2